MSSTTRPAPLVRAVVLNYEGGDLTLDCLRSLRATEWPNDRLDLVLVDNASHDGVADRVAAEMPDVRVLRSPTNRGFAGGCNLGLRELADVDHVALLNNDATVDPGWLRPLVDALETDPALGAACPKIVFADRYLEVTVRSPTVRRGRGDRRDLGVRVSGARVGEVDVWKKAQRVHGFWGSEPPERADEPNGQWTAADARLRLPVANRGASQASLRLSAVRAHIVTVTSGARTIDLTISRNPQWYEIPLDGTPIEVINNVGSVLTAEGYGADRGYLEPDDGRFDEPADVFAWCGAGVLLRRAYLDQVGNFDERLFVYYEDLELSWRGRRRGWRYQYVPASLVRHVHAATSVEGSPLKEYHDERNRLLVLTRHAPGRDVRRAIARYLLATGSYARRDMVSRLLRGAVPRASIVRRRLRAFVAFVIRAPGMWRSRRRDARRSQGVRVGC